MLVAGLRLARRHGIAITGVLIPGGEPLSRTEALSLLAGRDQAAAEQDLVIAQLRAEVADLAARLAAAVSRNREIRRSRRRWMTSPAASRATRHRAGDAGGAGEDQHRR